MRRENQETTQHEVADIYFPDGSTLKARLLPNARQIEFSVSPADYDKAAGRFINANTDEVRATAKEAQLFRALCEALAGKGIMEEDANA